jgi:hypothetical protein
MSNPNKENPVLASYCESLYSSEILKEGMEHRLSSREKPC